MAFRNIMVRSLDGYSDNSWLDCLKIQHRIDSGKGKGRYDARRKNAHQS